MAKEKFTSPHSFNLPLRNLLPMPVKPLQPTNIWKQKAADFNSAMYTDEACGIYRKRNVINTKKKKYVSGRRISISTFELYSQDDGEEVGVRSQRKIHFVDCAVGNTPARILRNLNIA